MNKKRVQGNTANESLAKGKPHERSAPPSKSSPDAVRMSARNSADKEPARRRKKAVRASKPMTGGVPHQVSGLFKALGVESLLASYERGERVPVVVVAVLAARQVGMERARELARALMRVQERSSE